MQLLSHWRMKWNHILCSAGRAHLGASCVAPDAVYDSRDDEAYPQDDLNENATLGDSLGGGDRAAVCTDELAHDFSSCMSRQYDFRRARR